MRTNALDSTSNTVGNLAGGGRMAADAVRAIGRDNAAICAQVPWPNDLNRNTKSAQ
ncbi:MAG TPA: hypothetical protein VFE73_07735 [Reyranella sp.]|jgi:hypothetical protein|nr:hypothetical protein [Reyranella sp.]